VIGILFGTLTQPKHILADKFETTRATQKITTSHSSSYTDNSWTKEQIIDLIANSDNPKTITSLVQCESNYVNIAKVDSNGYYSRGILQYQKATWDMWSKASGIIGDPMNPEDAIEMTDWAIEHNYLSHWTCSYITGLLAKK